MCDILGVDILGVDILGIDISGVDILGVDIFEPGHTIDRCISAIQLSSWKMPVSCCA